jgi:hypothetical protein
LEVPVNSLQGGARAGGRSRGVCIYASFPICMAQSGGVGHDMNEDAGDDTLSNSSVFEFEIQRGAVTALLPTSAEVEIEGPRERRTLDFVIPKM